MSLSISIGENGKVIYTDLDENDLSRVHDLNKLINGEFISLCTIVDPFVNGKKRYSKELMKACIKNDVPMNIITKVIVPKWSIDLILSSPENEVSFELNTMDDDLWNRQYTNSSHPIDLVHSAMYCFNNGIHVSLIIPCTGNNIITELDWLQVINAMRNWTHLVKIINNKDKHSRTFDLLIKRIKEFVEGNKLKFIYEESKNR